VHPSVVGASEDEAEEQNGGPGALARASVQLEAAAASGG